MSNDDIGFTVQVNLTGANRRVDLERVWEYLAQHGWEVGAEYRIPRKPKREGVGPKPEPTPSELAHERMLDAIKRGDAYTADQFRKLADDLRY